jgi:hypothetical protein
MRAWRQAMARAAAVHVAGVWRERQLRAHALAGLRLYSQRKAAAERARRCAVRHAYRRSM